MQLMKREDVERVARIVGGESAAAQALACAETMTDPVFVRTPGGIAVYDTAVEEEGTRR